MKLREIREKAATRRAKRRAKRDKREAVDAMVDEAYRRLMRGE